MEAEEEGKPKWKIISHDEAPSFSPEKGRITTKHILTAETKEGKTVRVMMSSDEYYKEKGKPDQEAIKKAVESKIEEEKQVIGMTPS